MTNKKVIQTKLHDAKKSVSTRDRVALSNNDKRRLDEMFARQAKIDEYNRMCLDIDPFFNEGVIRGSSVILRLFKENFIKAELGSEEAKIYDSYIGKVFAQKRPTDEPKWVENPLPYVFTGVVIAISPEAQAEEKDKFKRMSANSIDYTPLSVGDVVDIEHINFQERRYYKDKQKIDLIKSPEEGWTVKNFDGYFKVHPMQIEKIHTEQSLMDLGYNFTENEN